MSKKITKAVIPVAGKGTRFLPVAKGVFKTMFPIINKPTIQYLIEEAVQAGINEIIIVISECQKGIKDYFDINSDYYKDLKTTNKELEELEKIITNVKIDFVIQPSPKGLGDAILCTKHLIQNDDFALLLGDDLVQANDLEPYGIADLIKEYQNNPAYYIGVKEVPLKETHKYGIVEIKEPSKVMKVYGMIEKPQNNPPSNFAGVGRYILKNNVFAYLMRKPYDGINEIQLTDAFKEAIKEENVFAKIFNGKRFDIGDHAGYVKANISYALANDKIKDEIYDYIKQIVEKNSVNK